MTRHHCDRCGAELFQHGAVFAQVLGAADRSGLWELCERCAVELRSWVEAGAPSGPSGTFDPDGGGRAD